MAAYKREFGLTIEHPAIYDGSEDVDCRGEKQHLTTTAYVRTGATTRVYWMYMSGDGSAVTRKRQMPVLLRPAGTIRVPSC